MKINLKFAALILTLFGIIFPVGQAFAVSQVIRCDSCPSTKSAAIASGTGGTKIIVDFQALKMTGWAVEYDREIRVWRALPVNIPAGIVTSFNTDMSSEFSTAGAVITIRAGEDGGLIGSTSAFRDSNAYDILGSATFRSALETSMAANYASANSGNTSWNDIAFSVKALSLSFLGETKGIGSVTMRILWKDGSRTVLKIKADKVYQAEYQKGESADAMGNKVPDESVVDPAMGGAYAGNYQFQNPDALQDWINAASQYGIPITNGGGGGTRLTCTWNGTTLACRYVQL